LSFAPLNFQHGVLLARDIGSQSGAARATSMTRIYDVPTVALVLLPHPNPHTDCRNTPNPFTPTSINELVRHLSGGLQ